MTAIIAVKPGDSFEHWHDVTCRQFSHTECSPIAQRNFQARVTIKSLGGLALSRIWSSTQQGEAIRVSRRSADIRKDQRDCFMLWLMLDGSTQLYQDGRHVRLARGDLVLQDQSRPFDLEFGPLSHALMLAIPRPLLLTRLTAVDRMAARRIDAQSSMGPLAGALIQEVFSMEQSRDDRLEKRLSTSVLDLLSTVFDSELALPSLAMRREQRLEEIKAYMLAHLQNCELDVETLAQAASMSLRSLYRLFAREAITPMQWLWEQRLIASYRLLDEGSGGRVTDVALACGFKDVSHFSRVFRSRFGVSASSLGKR